MCGLGCVWGVWGACVGLWRRLRALEEEEQTLAKGSGRSKACKEAMKVVGWAWHGMERYFVCAFPLLLVG